MAPSTTLKFASWWEALFKKVVGQPPNELLLKLKQLGASSLALHLPPPTSKATTSPSALARATIAKVASVAKSKYSSYLHPLTPFIIGYMTIISHFFLAEISKKSKGIEPGRSAV